MKDRLLPLGFRTVPSRPRGRFLRDPPPPRPQAHGLSPHEGLPRIHL